MIDYLYALATGRHKNWRRESKRYLREKTRCVCCEQKSEVVHHVTPFHEDRSLEMVKSNWAAMCHHCHFVVGHKCNWRKWTKNFWQIVAVIRGTAAVVVGTIPPGPSAS